MALTPIQLRRFGLAASVLTAACDAAGPDGRDVRRSQVEIDLRKIHLTGQQGERITVIDTVALLITPANGAVQRLVRSVTSAEAPVTFDVTVEVGSVRFAATVLSNNGTMLYGAERDVDIQEDGFTVTLELGARSPVLAVAPDSMMLIGDGVGSIAVENIGSGTLDWSVLPVDGLRIVPGRGSIQAGGSQVVDVFSFGGVAPGESILLRFQSLVGELDAKVQGITPVFGVAVTPDGGTTVLRFENEVELSDSFVVRNSGNVTDTYAITCAGASQVSCTGTSLTDVTLDAAESVFVTAFYNVGSAGTGSLVLTATSSQTSDQGSYTVPINPPIGLRNEK